MGSSDPSWLQGRHALSYLAQPPAPQADTIQKEPGKTELIFHPKFYFLKFLQVFPHFCFLGSILLPCHVAPAVFTLPAISSLLPLVFGQIKHHFRCILCTFTVHTVSAIFLSLRLTSMDFHWTCARRIRLGHTLGYPAIALCTGHHTGEKTQAHEPRNQFSCIFGTVPFFHFQISQMVAGILLCRA